MLDQEDLKWIAATSTELNSILQQVSRYADLARRHRGEHNYIDLLGERVELASKTAQSLFDRVTSKILAGAARKTAAARKSEAGFKVMPAPPDTDDETPRSSRTSRKGEQKRGSSAEVRQSTASGDNGVPPGVRVKNPNGSREYLLLIEDEPDVADLASEMLAEEGYRVVIAHDGFEALKIYERMGKQIGLVILDYFLPVIDGDAVFDDDKTSSQRRGAARSSAGAPSCRCARARPRSWASSAVRA